VRKSLQSQVPSFDEFLRKTPGSVECINYPGKLALDIWEYVLTIGFGQCPSGHDVEVGKRHGYLLHYVRKGELQHVIDRKTHRGGSGCVCLMDASKANRILNETRAPSGLWWVLFGGKNMPRLFLELEADRKPVFDKLNRERIENLFKALWDLVSKRPLAHEARCHVVLNDILAELIASRAQPAGVPSLVPQKAQLSDEVRLAVRRFERIYYMAINLKETAAILGVDMYHFSRRFRREVGMAPIQYLNRYRIEQAKHLLKATNKSVNQIAPLVGISDPDYLARLFRKITGKTPRAWRKVEQRKKSGSDSRFA